MSEKAWTYVEGAKILKASIHELEMGTSDEDDQGYLLTNGTNRGMGCGLGEQGDLEIWVTTNGDDVLVGSEPDLDILRLLSDLPEQDPAQGMDRLREGVLEATERYPLGDPEMAWEAIVEDYAHMLATEQELEA